MQPQEFTQAVAAFAWSPAKTLIHMHHTWRPNHSQYGGLSSIEAMYHYHVNTNGWSDIAQHISIAPDGTIWTGRPWNASPASALGHNSNTVFMFETIGDFDVGKDALAGAQRSTVVLVIASVMRRFGLGHSALRFHNEMSTKSCPGSAVRKDDILNEVDAVAVQPENAPGGTGLEAALTNLPPMSAVRRSEILESAGAPYQPAAADDGEPPEHDPAYEKAIADTLRK
jgi:hypothetical protein